MRVTGIIEGFYGRPWSHDERCRWATRLRGWGMTHYVWAAKEEPRHRAEWSAPFTDDELRQFDDLAGRITLGIALTPGHDADAAEVIAKLAPTAAAVFVLSYDDLPTTDAGAHHRLMANELADASGRPVWVVPTHYAGLTGSPYLSALTDGLDPEIEVMWTGRCVVNDSISAEEAARRAEVTGRPPLLWDNTPVNDALMTEALHLGPYHGRDRGLVDVLSGVLLNPMEFADASVAPVASAAAWMRGDDPWTAWQGAIGDDLTLAQATAFPGDAHWPGDEPGDDWWHAVAALDDREDALDRWVQHARAGARIALDAGRLRSMLDYRSWSREPVLTLGRGPRLRPTFTQDHTVRFVPDGHHPVDPGSDLVARRLAAASRRPPSPDDAHKTLEQAAEQRGQLDP